MNVKRVMPNFAVKDPAAARRFYHDILGMRPVMDHGWMVTYASDAATTPQISYATQGGSDAPVPDVSIEVDDVNAVYAAIQQAGYVITYPICDEPWGVRRFFVTDPAGRTVNILMHLDA